MNYKTKKVVMFRKCFSFCFHLNYLLLRIIVPLRDFSGTKQEEVEENVIIFLKLVYLREKYITALFTPSEICVYLEYLKVSFL